MIGQRREAADRIERLAAYGQRGAKAVAQAALNHSGEQYAGQEIGGDAQRFKSRGQRSVRAAAVERGDQTDLP